MAAENKDRKFISIIESARGFAAFYILFHHVFFLAGDPSFFNQNVILHFIYKCSSAFTTHALMLFFLLSGFAIHYANAGRIESLKSAVTLSYFYKRFRRIYPIYLLAVIFSISAIALLDHLGLSQRWPSPSTKELVGALLVFSDLPSRAGTWIATLSTNGPLWSLSYEAAYYLMYPFFSILLARRGVSVALAAATLVSFSAVSVAVVYGATQIGNILSLYVLWCLGAFLAELKLRKYQTNINPTLIFCSLVFWIQSLWIFESFAMWRIPSAFSLYSGLCIFYLMMLPFISLKPAPWPTQQRIFCGVLLIIASAGTIAAGHLFKTTNDFQFFCTRVFIVFAIGCVWVTRSPSEPYYWAKRCLNPWHPSGRYSYALYILQFPILITTLTIIESASGSALLGSLTGVVLTVGIAMLVEGKFQPFVASWLDSALRVGRPKPRPQDSKI